MTILDVPKLIDVSINYKVRIVVHDINICRRKINILKQWLIEIVYK